VSKKLSTRKGQQLSVLRDNAAGVEGDRNFSNSRGWVSHFLGFLKVIAVSQIDISLGQ
jgi:hypothetical protein